MMPLDPAANVRQQCEAGGMALRKAVFAEALDLLEDALGVLARIAFFDHAADQPLVKRRQAAAPLPRRHGTAQESASPGLKSAASMAICITCSWKIGTPLVLARAGHSSFGQSMASIGRLRFFR